MKRSFPRDLGKSPAQPSKRGVRTGIWGTIGDVEDRGLQGLEK